MIVVTNRIKTKVGFAERMAPAFTKPGPLQSMKGFVKVEVLVTKHAPEQEHDELNVNMYWETLEDFQAWKNSDAFKQAHGHGSSAPQGESPILGSEIIVAEVAATIAAITE